MSGNHIREPWRIEKGGYGLYDVYDTDGNIIARAKIIEVARLMAAAPAMLKILQAIWDDVTAGGEWRQDVENIMAGRHGHLDVCLSAMELAVIKETIAKATGGSDD